MPSRLTTRSLPAIVLACAALCQTTRALAHDFWIEPAAFRPAVGTSLPVTLRVGEDFNGTSQPFVPDWFVDFSVSSPTGREPVQGFVGDDPAATLALKTPGLRLIGYHSTRAFVDLEAARFDTYLEKEGLERVRDLRRKRGQSAVNGREYYSRCAKSLVSSGGAPGPGFERDSATRWNSSRAPIPTRCPPGRNSRSRSTGRASPSPACSLSRSPPTSRRSGSRRRTGRDGRITLPLDRAGRWLVKAVHMIEVPDSDPAADWESFWASLTFEVRGPG